MISSRSALTSLSIFFKSPASVIEESFAFASRSTKNVASVAVRLAEDDEAVEGDVEAEEAAFGGFGEVVGADRVNEHSAVLFALD